MSSYAFYFSDFLSSSFLLSFYVRIYSCLSARSTLVGYNISSGLAEPSYCFPLLRRSPATPRRPVRTVFPAFLSLACVLSYNLITRKAVRMDGPAASERYILDFPSLETFYTEKLYPAMRDGGRRRLVALAEGESILR